MMRLWLRGGCTSIRATGTYKPVPVAEGVTSFDVIKKARGVVKKNPGASVVDLGDGVAGIELHSKMNALGEDIVSLITQTLKPGSAAVADFEAFVISGDSTNFSVGANLMQLLLGVQEEEWDEVDLMVRGFQNMTQAIKFCPRPVVVAPYGMCLGGGVEIAIHAAARQPHAELYLGLVETGVGLIPGGGGCKELTIRSVEAGNSIRPDGRGEGVETFEALKKNFETIAMAEGFYIGCRGEVAWFFAEDRLGDYESRSVADGCEVEGEGAGRGWVCGSGDADGHCGSGRERAGDVEAGGLDNARGAVHLRPRHEGGELGGLDSVRRKGDSGDAGERTVFIGPGAGGLLEPVRREEDAGTDCVYVEDGQAVEELTYIHMYVK